MGSFSTKTISLMEPAAILPLDDRCHHYEGRQEVPWDLQKCVEKFCHALIRETNVEISGTSLRDIPFFRCMMRAST